MLGCSCHAGTIAGRCAYCGAPRRARAPELGAAADLRGTAAERLNNAIVRLDFVTATAPVAAGVKLAIRQLAEHWQRFYRGAYWTLPDVAWLPKLGRYVEWYARGYALLPADVRAQAPAPAAIDPAFAELVDDAARRIVDANTSAAAATAQLVQETAQGVMGLGLLWLALGGLAVWKIYASAPRSTAESE